MSSTYEDVHGTKLKIGVVRTTQNYVYGPLHNSCFQMYHVKLSFFGQWCDGHMPSTCHMIWSNLCFNLKWPGLGGVHTHTRLPPLWLAVQIVDPIRQIWKLVEVVYTGFCLETTPCDITYTMCYNVYNVSKATLNPIKFINKFKLK